MNFPGSSPGKGLLAGAVPRHSHATELLLAGVHPKVAQEQLGHSTVTTTLDRYSPVTPAMQEDAADSLDAALRGAMIAYAGPKKRSVAISVATAVSGRQKVQEKPID